MSSWEGIGNRKNEVRKWSLGALEEEEPGKEMGMETSHALQSVTPESIRRTPQS